MMSRPFTFINVAMTVDGKIDTFERRGSTISSTRDKQRVDRLRAGSDAILVGGRTLLGDDPKLTVKSESLRADRTARGLSPNPIKIGVVTVANIKAESEFLTAGPARVVIFTTTRTSRKQLDMLQNRGVELRVQDAPRVNLTQMMEGIREIGAERLMVEGGGTMNFELIRLGLVDEINVFVAPMIFGGAQAPTLAEGNGLTPEAAIHMHLIGVEHWDDGGVLLRYAIN